MFNHYRFRISFALVLGTTLYKRTPNTYGVDKVSIRLWLSFDSSSFKKT